MASKSGEGVEGDGQGTGMGGAPVDESRSAVDPIGLMVQV